MESNLKLFYSFVGVQILCTYSKYKNNILYFKIQKKKQKITTMFTSVMGIRKIWLELPGPGVMNINRARVERILYIIPFFPNKSFKI